jgi:hypothetical protein
MRYGGGGNQSGFGPALFGSTGWLFADLMVALALAFLVANTVGQPPPPTTTSTTTTAPPTTTTLRPTTTTVEALDLRYIDLTLTRVDYQGLVRRDAKAIAAVKRQVRRDHRLAGRRAGLVILFGGASGTNPSRGRQAAIQVQKVLADMGRHGFVFKDAVYRPFFDLQKPSTVVQLNVYVFRKPHGP